MKKIEIEIPEGYKEKTSVVKQKNGKLRRIIVDLVEEIKDDYEKEELTPFELNQVKKMHL